MDYGWVCVHTGSAVIDTFRRARTCGRVLKMCACVGGWLGGWGAGLLARGEGGTHKGGAGVARSSSMQVGSKQPVNSVKSQQRYACSAPSPIP